VSTDDAGQAFEQWQGARRALDHALDDFLADRGSTRTVFVRVAELRRSEEVAWAALQQVVAEGGIDPDSVA